MIYTGVGGQQPVGPTHKGRIGANWFFNKGNLLTDLLTLINRFG